MGELFASWIAGTRGVAAELFWLLGGNIGPIGIVIAAGAVCLILGLALSITWRETQSFWMLPVILLATLAPVAVGLANHLAGSLGAAFSLCAGAVILLLATALIANEATKRSPIWLIGAFSAVLATGCALFGFDFASLA